MRSTPLLRFKNIHTQMTATMKIEIEDVDSCNKKITLDIPYQDYRKKVDAQYAIVGQQINIPGFRKGKVPKSVIENRFGPEVKRDVLTQIISESITRAIEEKGIKAVTPPSLLKVEAEEGTDIKVSASVEVIPDFTINDYSRIELYAKINKVTEKEVDEVIAEYRLRGAKNFPVTGRPTQDKDIIKIDFKAEVDGQALTDMESNDFTLQVGAQGSLAAFNEGVLGMQIGEERDIPIDYAADYGNKAIAGKTVSYHVTLKEIQAQELPEVNDEFAQNLKEKYKTVDEMKQKTRQDLEDYEKKQARKAARKQLAEKITEMNPIHIPEGLVREQIGFMAKEVKKKQAQAHDHKHTEDCGHDHGVEETSVSLEDEKTYRTSAIKILQEELLISQLADDFKIEVSEEELDQEINGFMALLGGGNPQKIKQEWRKNGSLDRLRSRMRREKTLDQLLGKIQLKEEMIDRQEILANN